MNVIACIEDPVVIKQILDHLKHKAETSESRALPESRAPPAELPPGLSDCRARKPTIPIKMLRSRRRGRGSPCRVAGMSWLRRKEGEFSAHWAPCQPDPGGHTGLQGGCHAIQLQSATAGPG
jgi:hypothetical protein